MRKNNLNDLETYSVDYKDNDKNFKKTAFQPNQDSDYVDFISEKLHTNHHKVILDNGACDYEQLEKVIDDYIASKK